MKIKLRIHGSKSGYQWEVWRNGLVTAYVLPVRMFRTPASVLAWVRQEERRRRIVLIPRLSASQSAY